MPSSKMAVSSCQSFALRRNCTHLLGDRVLLMGSSAMAWRPDGMRNLGALALQMYGAEFQAYVS